MDSQLEKIAYVYGDVCVRKKRRKRQKLIVIELIFDYFQNSTLHGLRYIAERGLHIVERLFWFITFMASISMCIYLIYTAFVKWKTSPVIVTVNGRLASAGTVPFPSVTICPEIKCKKSVYNYTEASEKIDNDLFGSVINESLPADFINKFDNIDKICDHQRMTMPSLSNFSTNLVEHITEVALTPDDIFFACKWFNIEESCTDLFSKVYTEEGVCYTANSLASKDIFTDNIQKNYSYLESTHPIVGWSPETGEYTNYSINSPYPRRGRVYGSSSDLEIQLIVNPDERDNECNIIYSGFKIFLHHPMDYPTSSLYYYAALPGQTSTVAISFHQLNTDINLLTSKAFKYPADVRQCYFQSERPLRYFKLYTANNCRAECLSNYTYSRCGCVEYYMPHNDSSKICAKHMQNCVEEARDYMAFKERSAELSLEKNDQACLCRPACDNIEYDAEILKTDYHLAQSLKNMFKKVFGDELFGNVRFAQVKLFFKKPQFVTMQRRELFGIVDFLADIGGLLGLFLGFSLLSLVEVFYFITLRIGIKIKRDLKEEKRQKKPDEKEK